MTITIKRNIDLTPALETYLEKKFAPLEGLIVALGVTDPAELTIEVKRTTKRHRKGPVYRASAKLHWQKVILRADEIADDVRVAIDAAKDTLREELEKYKNRKLNRKTPPSF